MIRIENVTKKYREVIAVDNLSLHIKKGECFAFLGPNGAGKATTIKLITGLIRPDSGSIKVAGYDIKNDYIEAKKCISYVPDVPYLYDKLTGYEFLEFIANLYNMDKDKMYGKIDYLTNLFSLDKHRHQLIEDYSHGLKQRLSICAALLHDPKIIIIDEPMVALDPIGIRLVKTIFKECVKAGVTVFMSTHTLSVAEEIADRIGIIHNGRLRIVGTRQELQDTAKKKEMEEIFIQLTNEEE